MFVMAASLMMVSHQVHVSQAGCGAHSLEHIALTSEGSKIAVSGVRFDRSFLKRQSGSRGQRTLHDCYCRLVVRKDPSKAPCKGEMDLTPTPRLK